MRKLEKNLFVAVVLRYEGFAIGFSGESLAEGGGFRGTTLCWLALQ